MFFDFTTMLDRHGKDAMALDALGNPGGFAPGAPLPGIDAIPMWVADMNFPTAPSVMKAISERAAHPAFGYFLTAQEYVEAIVSWLSKRHGASGVEPCHVAYQNGVLGGVASALYAFTEPGDSVLVHSPTYIGFTRTVARCGRTIDLSPLVRDAEGVWRMDLADMEQRIVSDNVKVAIFCSPHNPCGRLWERWELEAASELFAKHGVIVVSDEIWADFSLRGKPHVPYFMVSDSARAHSITLGAPSKTFNLAGLVGSYSLVFDEGLRKRFATQCESSCYNNMNVLSMHALIGAYAGEGAEWVDDMLQVLAENVDALCDFVDATEGLEAFRPEATYMAFIDATQWCCDHGVGIDELEQRLWDAGVAIQDGRMFHGPCHLRANVALPHAVLQEAIHRMEGIFGN